MQSRAGEHWPQLASVCSCYSCHRLWAGITPLRPKEQWRESASFILGQPDCAEGRIYVFGDTANYRYLVGKSRLRLKLIAIPPDRAATTRIEPPGGDCRVILWAADLSPSEFEQLLSTLHLEHSCMRVTAFYWAFVVTHDAGDAGDLVCSSEPISGVD
jgi:hypothetical protein